MRKIRVGDSVKVILGDEKGKTGTVKNIFHNKNKATIEGINTKIKHIKPIQKEKIGKIIKFDAPISISNIMICNKNGITSKIGFIFLNGEKKRILKKTQEVIQ